MRKGEKNGGPETTGSREPQRTERTGLPRIKNPEINTGQADTSRTVKCESMEIGCQSELNQARATWVYWGVIWKIFHYKLWQKSHQSSQPCAETTQEGHLHLPGCGGNPTCEGTSVDQSQPMQPWSNRDMGVNHRSRLGKTETVRGQG